jgi:L-2,4-diaminobutyric acid acetyltransferase
MHYVNQIEPGLHTQGESGRTRQETGAGAGETSAGSGRVVFRTPVPEDGLAVWRLVESTPGLDSNSPYYYTLWFRDFAESSLIATVDDEVVGLLTGYRRPEAPDTYFVWQTAVSPRHGIPFLGVKLFQVAADRQVGAGVRFVEATVSSENKAILMVLKQYGKKRSADIRTEVLFPSSMFPDSHHDEVLYRIGPLTG